MVGMETQWEKTHEEPRDREGALLWGLGAKVGVSSFSQEYWEAIEG